MVHVNENHRNGPTRRDALKLAAAGAVAVAATLPTLPTFAADKKRAGIALQLYSVRNDCAKDFVGTLKALKEMGFEGVEFAGYHQFGGKAKELRKVLDDIGLQAEGCHIGAGSFDDNNFDKTVDFHKELGLKFMIVPGDGRFTKPDKCQEYADFMTKTAEKLKPHDMYCGHHNHTHEFGDYMGSTFWDFFATHTSKDVILQQDFGWTVVAGKDPVEYIKKYPGRTRTCHFKSKLPKGAPAGAKPFIGEGVMDWKGIITACHTVGGTDWMTVEQEDYPDGLSPMQCAERTLSGLKKILGEMNML
ncbi:MAG: TIM barrel protein [Phycisphaera sp.]|nr:TIM barrel protein [Phycisphaera sp.]